MINIDKIDLWKNEASKHLLILRLKIMHPLYTVITIIKLELH